MHVFYIVEFFPKANELSDLLQFEEECVAEYLRKRDSLYLTSKEERIRLILERYFAQSKVFLYTFLRIKSRAFLTPDVPDYYY